MALITTINVSTPNDHLGDTLRDSQIIANNNFAELNSKKVETAVGFGLSENNFSDADKAKLDSMDLDAQVNVQPDWLQADNTQDDYIKNKPNIGQPASFRAAGSGQIYTLPIGAIAFKGYINDAVQHKEDASFTSDLNTFTQSGDDVTFKKTITSGQRIVIDYTL